MNTETIVAIATFVLATGSGLIGVVFFIGRLSARVDRLEEWRVEVRDMHRENLGRLDRIEREIRNRLMEDDQDG